MKLVQACLYAGNTLQRRFDRRGGAMKHVQLGLCASSDQESSLHHCGGPVKLVQSCLCVREASYNAVLTSKVAL